MGEQRGSNDGSAGKRVRSSKVKNNETYQECGGRPSSGVATIHSPFLSGRGLDEIAPPGQLGPSFWPRMILVGLALACAAKLVVDVRSA